MEIGGGKKLLHCPLCGGIRLHCPVDRDIHQRRYKVRSALSIHVGLTKIGHIFRKLQAIDRGQSYENKEFRFIDTLYRIRAGSKFNSTSKRIFVFDLY